MRYWFCFDHSIIEHTPAALELARDLIAGVLSDVVEAGYFGKELALEIGRRIMYENGAEFWRICDDG